ncbi:MAG: hypothetical protein HY898_25220 [Deltaproteobacteria bacterium]|nr:hypothetical protein [Deltaproteobacteria bacterium]
MRSDKPHQSKCGHRGRRPAEYAFMIAVGAMIVASSCAPFSVYQSAKTRAAAELPCPEASIAQAHLANSGGYEYAFEGCGRKVVIRCMESVSTSTVVCDRSR